MASEPLVGVGTATRVARGQLRQLLPIDWGRVRAITNEKVPGHIKRWWFALGGTPAYLFLVQIATGILLSFYYVPTPDHAYESVQGISTTVSFGWFVRSVHKWAAHLMIITVLLHMWRVFFSGAFRHPRQLNWVLGCGLLVGTLGLGFTGYALAYEQLSYWGVTVAAELTSATPIVGDVLASFLRGGDEVGSNTLIRMYNLHVRALPAMLILLIGLHVAVLRLHGVSNLLFEPSRAAGGSPARVPASRLLGIRVVALLAAMLALGCLVTAVLNPVSVRLFAHTLAPESSRLFWVVAAAILATAAVLLFRGHLYGLMLWLVVGIAGLGRLMFDLANHEAGHTFVWAVAAVVLAVTAGYGIARHRYFSEGKGEDRAFDFFPDHILTELMIGTLLLFLLTLLSLVFPAGLGERADPLITPEHIKPEWYFFFQFHLLKLTGLRTAVVFTGLLSLLVILWPWVDALLERLAPGKDLGVYVGIVAVVVFLTFTVWEGIA